MKLSSVNSIHHSYHHVYVSPHMDDAVLSCGGSIAMQVARGERILVVTVFSEIDETRAAFAMPGIPPGGFREMQDEDETAMERLGVDHLRLNYLDGACRQRFPLLRYGLHLCAAKRFAGLLETLLTDLERICSATACRNLYFPLGIGQHIDHHLAFLIGDQWRQKPVDHPSVLFYEDIPYALIPHALDYRLRAIGYASCPTPNGKPSIRRNIMAIYRSVGHLSTLTRNRFFRKATFLIALSTGIICMEAILRLKHYHQDQCLQPDVVDAASFFETKVEAICDYRSQVKILFENKASLRRSLEQYSQNIGGAAGQYRERCWKNAGRN